MPCHNPMLFLIKVDLKTLLQSAAVEHMQRNVASTQRFSYEQVFLFSLQAAAVLDVLCTQTGVGTKTKPYKLKATANINHVTPSTTVCTPSNILNLYIRKLKKYCLPFCCCVLNLQHVDGNKQLSDLGVQDLKAQTYLLLFSSYCTDSSIKSSTYPNNPDSELYHSNKQENINTVSIPSSNNMVVSH